MLAHKHEDLRLSLSTHVKEPDILLYAYNTRAGEVGSTDP